MAKRKRKKRAPKWWLPYLAVSDQEIERGRYIYEALLEEETVDEKSVFDVMLSARNTCLANCSDLKPDGDNEKWLFYATCFLGIGMMMRERIEIYEEIAGD